MHKCLNYLYNRTLKRHPLKILHLRAQPLSELQGLPWEERILLLLAAETHGCHYLDEYNYPSYNWEYHA